MKTTAENLNATIKSTIKLLTTNTKLSKLNGERFAIAGLSLAPHTLAGRKSMCAWASPGCAEACVLHHAGMHVMESVREAQKNRTLFLLDHPVEFHAQLRKEISRFIAKCEAKAVTPLLRLNTASDLNWGAIIREFIQARFYDYTASLRRALSNELGNYDLTFSRKETTPLRDVLTALRSMVNVAIVFDVLYNPQHDKYGPLPEEYLGFKVVDGDKHDFRLHDVDGKGVIVGLRLKGGLESKARARASGFAIDPTKRSRMW